MSTPVILDVDTGADDAVAIFMAGRHPAVELRAILTTHGNAPHATTLENTLRTVSVGELTNVPVYPGADFPLVSKMVSTFEIQHRLLALPETSLTPETKRAADFLVEYYMSEKGPETIYVPLGPQTNLALALSIEPQLAKRIPAIVTMAGSIYSGNTTPSAEFNIIADPEAAHIVFNSGIPITMVGLEVTKKAFVTREDVNAMKALGTPWGEASAKLTLKDVNWFDKHTDMPGAEVYDACAIAAIVDKDLLTTKPMRVDIELSGQHTRGKTVADLRYYGNT
ncbi:MAG: nucleoside hydrolase, partial [Anaerolineaceae bacterium]|nr:nucleoside hydrolase [Anaerolineaceae bacterium]